MTRLIRAGALAAPALALALFAGQVAADGHRTAAPEGAMSYIVNISDGDTVSSPVTIVFGLKGMGVAPAGVEKENTGHHHLLVNLDAATINLDDPLPADENHIHFGGGQTETTIELPAGTHTLQLLLADHNHVPHNPPVISEKITVTVE